MIEKYRKYSKNQGEGVEKILGNKSKVSSFAKFWEQNGDELEVAAAYLINEFNVGEDYTKEEAARYRQGIGDISAIFMDAWLKDDQNKKDKLVK